MKLTGAAVTLRSLSYGGPDADIPNLKPEPWHAEVEPWTLEKKYFNWILFPNTHVVSATCGHSFSIEHHMPASGNQTDVAIYMLTTKRKSESFNARPVLTGHFDGAFEVLDEDFEVLEQVQRQLNGRSGLRSILGAYEWLNVGVESWYVRRMWPSKNLNPISLATSLYHLVGGLIDYSSRFGLRRLIARVQLEFKGRLRS